MMSHAGGWVGRLNCVTLPENALGGGGGLQSCVTEHAHLTIVNVNSYFLFNSSFAQVKNRTTLMS